MKAWIEALGNRIHRPRRFMLGMLTLLMMARNSVRPRTMMSGDVAGALVLSTALLTELGLALWLIRSAFQPPRAK